MSSSLWQRVMAWMLEHRLVAAVVAALIVGAGLVMHPFDELAQRAEVLDGVPRQRVAVDAIPDIGENQQIVFTSWPGRSPRDIEDHVTYPLTTELLGLPGVRTIRSSSMFGFSSVYVIFEEGAEFYWARSRLLEKLASLPPGLLPDEVTPRLGPSATALGQVYWYTLEGRDPRTGEVLGGWDLHELRTIQDAQVRPALQSTQGVAEVASIGGHVVEYQVEIDPTRLEAYALSITKIATALRQANKDVSARTLEINRVEYIVRGIGQLRGVEDIEETIITERGGRPVRIKDVAKVSLGPAQRRGALDVAGAEAVGGVVAARHGANPVEVIEALQAKIDQLSKSLPTRTLDGGRVAKLTVVPFYNRAEVVEETLETLSDALLQQILITIVVIIVLLGNLRSAIVVSSILPLAVLASFVLMGLLGVTANVMSLAGIAIAIGTMVDMGIVLTENMQARFDAASPGDRLAALSRGAAEVAPAIITSSLTTVLSFLPVFGLTAAEGKLFHPLAYTKTFALLAALVLSLAILPALASVVFRAKPGKEELAAGPWGARFWATLASKESQRDLGLIGLGVAIIVAGAWWLGALVTTMGLAQLVAATLPTRARARARWPENLIALAGVIWLLTRAWMPLGHGASLWHNVLFVAVVCLGLSGGFWALVQVYRPLLRAILGNKLLFSLLPTAIIAFGALTWLGYDGVTGTPTSAQTTPGTLRDDLREAFPGLGQEFMPPFDEGQFLYMPTTMPHASIGQALEQLKLLDAAIATVPEVEDVVGKLGRAESALDPAPVSMFETVVTYKPEWRVGEDGERVRQWRPHIKSTDDIWDEIVAAAKQPGLTSAPKLMPIQTRIVMLQSGMRAPMGVQVRAPDLESLEQAGRQLEALLVHAPAVRAETVFAERVVGKPYLEIELLREEIARFGVSVEDAQRTLQIGLGGAALTSVLKGRERIDVTARFTRDARMGPDQLERLLVFTPSGQAIPLGQLATIKYVKGPQVIKSEDTFPTSYVIFDKIDSVSEVDAVEQVRELIESHRRSGQLVLPDGVTYTFAGSYQNQQRSQEKLALLIPIALLLIFLVLYIQFRRPSTVAIIYTSVAVAIAGGFMLMWFYQQPWFMNGSLGEGLALRELFQVSPTNLSVAVWVGFIALVGIATDDGVVMATYLDQRLEGAPPTTRAEVHEAILDAGSRRIRPCLMTTATTLLAMLPVIMSTGRGSDVMIPMAIPVLGGMLIEIITLFVVPALYCAREELRLLRERVTT